MNCSNYRILAQISHLCKIILNILQERLRVSLQENLNEEQGGLMRYRSTIRQIKSINRWRSAKQVNKPTSHCSVDFKRASDSAQHEGLRNSLTSMVENFARNVTDGCLVKESISEWVRATIGSRPGDRKSPFLFISISEKSPERHGSAGVWTCCHAGICRLRPAICRWYRFVGGGEPAASLQLQLAEVYQADENFGLLINMDKIKVEALRTVKKRNNCIGA